jgi:hypothetical protein
VVVVSIRHDGAVPIDASPEEVLELIRRNFERFKDQALGWREPNALQPGVKSPVTPLSL